MGPVLRAARWPPSVDVKGELRFLPSLSSEPWPQPHPPFEGSLLRKSPLPMGFWVCGRVSVALDSKVRAPSPRLCHLQTATSPTCLGSQNHP